MGRKLLYIVNVDWFFLSHRLPIAVKAVQEGYEVHIACSYTKHREYFDSLGFITHDLLIVRNGSDSVKLIKSFYSIFCLLHCLRPDILHLITIQPCIFGGIAAKTLRIKSIVFAISGLGTSFSSTGLFARFRLFLVSLMYRLSFSVPNKVVIFQNNSDMTILQKVAKICSRDCIILAGSGVDLAQFTYEPLRHSTPPVVLMACRLLRSKGVLEFVNAANLLKDKLPGVEFWLVGDIDLDNLDSLTADTLRDLRFSSNVNILGYREDISELMKQATLICLPSYYAEGLPKVLCEAAAIGRPVITTDLPGCRDAIEAGVTGFLVKPADYLDLSCVIDYALSDLGRLQEMSFNARIRAEKMFDVNQIVEQHLSVYRNFCSLRA